MLIHRWKVTGSGPLDSFIEECTEMTHGRTDVKLVCPAPGVYMLVKQTSQKESK